MIGRLVQGLRSTLLLVSPSAPARPGRDPVREALLVQFIGLLRAATPPGHPRPRPGAPGVGFGLCVDKSTIEGAERGLFLARGAAEQGAAVVVYPGRVHLALPPLTQRLEIEGAELEDHSAELAGCGHRAAGWWLSRWGSGRHAGAAPDHDAVYPRAYR